eukprot:GEMP01009347.1.p1 GENE.GEMP01009347.1~~GEMP01009347.1.p1  ORF type:complete len:779 (+),score=174.48 GEMP01009347.1:370-2706(+)
MRARAEHEASQFGDRVSGDAHGRTGVSDSSDAQRPRRMRTRRAVSSPGGSPPVGACRWKSHDAADDVDGRAKRLDADGSNVCVGFHDAWLHVLLRHDRLRTAQRFFLLWHVMAANVWSRRQKILFRAMKAHALSEAEEVVLHQVRLAKLECAGTFLRKHATSELATVFRSWKVLVAVHSIIPHENRHSLDQNLGDDYTLPLHPRGAVVGFIASAPSHAAEGHARGNTVTAEKNPFGSSLYSCAHAAEKGENGNVGNPNIRKAGDAGIADSHTYVIDSGLRNFIRYDDDAERVEGQENIRISHDTENGGKTCSLQESPALVSRQKLYTLYREEKDYIFTRRRKMFFYDTEDTEGGDGRQEKGNVETDNEAGLQAKSRRLFAERDSRGGDAVADPENVVCLRDADGRAVDTDLHNDDTESDYGAIWHNAASTSRMDAFSDMQHPEVVSDNHSNPQSMNGHRTSNWAPRPTDLAIYIQPASSHWRPNGVNNDTAENVACRFAPLLGGGQQILRTSEQGVYSSQSGVACSGAIGDSILTMVDDGDPFSPVTKRADHEAGRRTKNAHSAAKRDELEWIADPFSDGAPSSFVLDKRNTATVASWKVVERERRTYAFRAWKNIVRQQHVQERVAARIVRSVALAGKREWLRLAFEWWRSWLLDFRCNMLAAAVERQSDARCLEVESLVQSCKSLVNENMNLRRFLDRAQRPRGISLEEDLFKAKERAEREVAELRHRLIVQRETYAEETRQSLYRRITDTLPDSFTKTEFLEAMASARERSRSFA